MRGQKRPFFEASSAVLDNMDILNWGVNTYSVYLGKIKLWSHVYR